MASIVKLCILVLFFHLCRLLLLRIRRSSESATLSQHQKYHKVIIVAQGTGSSASEVVIAGFRRGYDVFKMLRDAWVSGKEVLVNVLNEGSVLYDN